MVNTLAFVTSLSGTTSADLKAVTKSSIGSGLTTIQLRPRDLTRSIIDELILKITRDNAEGAAQCNCALTFAASSTSAVLLTDKVVESLLIPFDRSLIRTEHYVLVIPGVNESLPFKSRLDCRSVLLETCISEVSVRDVEGDRDMLVMVGGDAQNTALTRRGCPNVHKGLPLGAAFTVPGEKSGRASLEDTV